MAEPFLNEKEQIKQALKEIKFKIAVHSGKGGVGKTFFSINLAYLLKDLGYAVGILDADVDCPNIPKHLKVDTHMTAHGNNLVPVSVDGIKIASTAFLNDPADPDAPIIVRGPIKHRLLMDFLTRTEWGKLDFLIFDLPPGTSDVPLSTMQIGNLDGIILVTTPTSEAILDTKRSGKMAQTMNARIVGLVENMSGEVFGEGKALELAKDLHIEFLGSIPLKKEHRELSEKGKPALLKSESAKNLVKKIIELL